MTLVELLVAAAMSVVIVGAAGSMLVSAVRDQPKISKRAQDVSTARWVLERMTREIRNGIRVEEGATATQFSILTYVRHECGSGGALSSDTPAEQCEVTYECDADGCSRTEAGGTAQPVFAFAGLGDEVFCYVPSTNEDPSICGPADDDAPPTYVGITLDVPSETGNSNPGGDLEISDGASLRNATLLN